ncbi:hypothetical protein [Komagataeibacter xylinus]|nr:hypothetical protein [Komagataeibacter xylinus]
MQAGPGLFFTHHEAAPAGSDQPLAPALPIVAQPGQRGLAAHLQLTTPPD